MTSSQLDHSLPNKDSSTQEEHNDNEKEDTIMNQDTKEDSTLLTKKPACQIDKEPTTVFVPPDGGWRAWLVLLSCCLTNGIIFGIINTFGILYDKLHSKMEAEGVEDAAAKCAFVGSLAIGTTFFLSSFVGVLSDRIGIRATAVTGGIIATLGMGLAMAFSNSVVALYFTYGILFGTGSSLAYTPSLTILGHYFRRHMGIANGVVTAGSSVFTIALSFINPYILKHENGLTHCLGMFTAMTSVLIACAFTFKPLIPPGRSEEKASGSSRTLRFLEKVIHLDNWRNKRYVIWALAIPSALFGYFVPYVHIVTFAKDIPLDASDDDNNGLMAAKLMTCVGITSGIGRLVFGKVADMESVKANGNRIVLQQVAFVCIGGCTMLLTAAQQFGETTVYPALMVFCLIMGFFDGCFITLLGPIAFDICGPTGAGQAIGFLLCLCSVPLTVGPPIAGLLYDHLNNYTLAFILAGVPPMLGAGLMFIIRRYPSPKEFGVDGTEKTSSKTKESVATSGDSGANGADGEILL